MLARAHPTFDIAMCLVAPLFFAGCGGNDENGNVNADGENSALPGVPQNVVAIPGDASTLLRWDSVEELLIRNL